MADSTFELLAQTRALIAELHSLPTSLPELCHVSVAQPGPAGEIRLSAVAGDRHSAAALLAWLRETGATAGTKQPAHGSRTVRVVTAEGRLAQMPVTVAAALPGPVADRLSQAWTAAELADLIEELT